MDRRRAACEPRARGSLGAQRFSDGSMEVLSLLHPAHRTGSRSSSKSTFPIEP